MLEFEEDSEDEDDVGVVTGDSIELKKERVREINLQIKELLDERDELEREIEELNDDFEAQE